jgi:hypothetical protein
MPPSAPVAKKARVYYTELVPIAANWRSEGGPEWQLVASPL